MEGRGLRRGLPHPPEAETTAEEPAHAWPDWALFSPLPWQAASTPGKSVTDADAAADATPSETGGALLPRDTGAGGRETRCQLPRRRNPQIRTVALLAFVLCFGVCLVGIFGFLPIYFIGSRNVSSAVQIAQTQAVASMVASASMSMSRLPNIIKFVLATYMSSYECDRPCKSLNESEALFFLANVVSQERYGDSLAFLSAVHPVRGREGFVGVSTFLKNVSLVAATALDEEVLRLFAMDTETHRLEAPFEVLSDFGISVRDYIDQRQRDMLRQSRQGEAEAVPESVPEAPVSKELWLPWNFTGKYASFSLVVPLQLSAKGECTAFMEGALRSTYIANIIHDHFRYAIRQHGCYMMVNLQNDMVVINSWNRSYFSVDNYELSCEPFSVSAIDHPLMKAAVGVLRVGKGLRTVAETITDMEGETLTFTYEGKKAVLRVSPIGAPHRLNLVFLSVTIQRDFFTNIDRTLSALSYTMLAAVTGMAVMSCVVAVYLRCSLQQLTAALRASSKLQFPPQAGSSSPSRSHITELEDVGAAYTRVQQELMTLKTVLPCSLLIPEDAALSESDDEGAGGSGSRCRSSTQSSDVAPTPRWRPRRPDGGADEGEADANLSSIRLSDVSQGGQLALRVSKRWQQNVVLNTKVFNENVNVFRQRYCTIVWISHYYTAGIRMELLDEFFKVVYAAATEFKGCLQCLRPDYVVVTFNAHTSLPMHAKLACDLALAIRKRVAPAAAESMTTLVDTNNFYVGTCGSEKGLKCRAVFDFMHLYHINKAMRTRGYYGVVVTQSTAKHLEYHETVPLDVVSVPFHEAPYTMYELRDTSAGDVAAMRHTAELFRSGFQRMRVGDYVNALRSFARVPSSDVAAQRLKLLCMKSIREGNKEPYMYRVRLPRLRILSRVVHLRNTSNMHLFAARLWVQNQVGGFFRPGPFTMPTREEVDDSAPSEHVLDASVRMDRDDRRGDVSEAIAPIALTCTSSLAAASPDNCTGQSGATATEDSDRRSTAASSDAQERALIEWVDFLSASDTDDVEELPTRGPSSPTAAAADTIPLCLLDSNGEQWNRALKPDHSGSASVVYQAMADDGLQVAIKFLPKKNRSIPEARLYNEIGVMAKLKHLNIVQYISYVRTAAHIGIVMEYAPGGSLRDIIGSFGALPESLVRRYMVDILHGLAYLHRGGITHGDVKPHNILLGADGVCKLSDFGSTVCEATDLARSNGMLEFRGTAVYTSPEVASGQQPTAASDIYSLGISFLEMLMGRLPWHWSDPKARARRDDCMTVREVAFVQAVGRGEITPVIPLQLSTAAREFAHACCRASTETRPTVAELLSFRFVL